MSLMKNLPTSLKHVINRLLTKIKSQLQKTTLYILLLITGAASAAPSAIPEELLGQWEVREVHLNTTSGRTFHYGWNSPSLRWRIFSFEKSHISNNTPEKSIPCNAPIADVEFKNVSKMLNTLLGYDEHADQSAAEHYKLEIPEHINAKFIKINCSDGAWNGAIFSAKNTNEHFSNGAWLFFLKEDEIALRWYDQTLLILKKIHLNTKPTPSFPCEKARLNAEIAICKSHELAGLDKGVAAAYNTLLSFTKNETPNDVSRVRHEQNEWLKVRNSCGADTSCLSKSMEQRVNDMDMPLD